MVQDQIVDWLLEGDPAIRWQVMRDLLEADGSEYGSVRERVASEGWGRRLLERQEPAGLWSGSLYNGKWTSTTYTLYLLKLLGLPPRHPQALLGCRRLLESGLYEGREIRFSRGARVPDLGVTALVLSICAYFEVEHDSLAGIAQHLIDHQESGGGWRPDDSPSAGAYVFETTLLALEALIRWRDAAAGGPEESASVEAARKGQRFLLERELCFAPGSPRKPGWTSFAFPPYWFYDVLTALDYLRTSGTAPEPRMQKAVELVEYRRTREGRWKLGAKHPGRTFFDMETTGQPSRWNTLRALRVIAWWRD